MTARDALTVLAGRATPDLSDASTEVIELTGLERVGDGAAFVGPALTVDTRLGDNASVRAALDELGPGNVLVVSGKGYRERALMGDRLARRAVEAGAVAIVIDGALRDVDAIAELGVPVYFRHRTVLRATKHGLGGTQRPVAVCGEVVGPGDLVVGDGDGLCVVPAGALDEVVAALSAPEGDA